MDLAKPSPRTAQPLTGCQAFALCLDRAWTAKGRFGDPLILSLFLELLQGLRRETITWPAPARVRLDPLVGHYVRGSSQEADPDPAELDGRRVQGSLERWALGLDRESAREWARELDAAVAGPPREAPMMVDGSFKKADADLLCAAAAADMTMDGYAFALAFLLDERDDGVRAGYSILRTLLGVQAHRYIAHRPAGYIAISNDTMLPAVYRAASRPWVGLLFRRFEQMQADVARDPVVSAVLYPSYEDRGAHGHEQAQAARLRGFIPHLHKIPKSAFAPEPSPQEKEEV